MHLPGVNTIADGIGKVTRRFPFSMLIALIGTASAYSLVHFDSLDDEWSVYRLLMTAVLGFLLYVVLQLKLEREKVKGNTVYWVKMAAAIFLALYYWQLPADFNYAGAEFVIRFFLLGLALLFSLTFIPFIRHAKEVNGFWQYCKILFIRLFLTFVFTGSLYLGLVLALVATKQLLGVDFDETIFFEMWIVIVGLISTSFFLAGIPEKTATLQKKTDYHKAIQVFAQYILTPLILIYAVILYIYTGKIIIHWDWPEGMVSWLIIVFSLAGILANFMLYPLLKKEKWVSKFLYISYALIIPMSVVMFLALKIRIDEYGFTELRYYGMVLCFWFLAMSLYFIFSKKKNLMLLPVTLFVITLISSAGPVSAMNVSKRSQMTRLETALIENGILVDGKVKKIDKELSDEAIRTISGSLDYIRQVHGWQVIQPWFDEKLDFTMDHDCWGSQCVMDLMGVEYMDRWTLRPMIPGESITDYRHFYVEQGEPLNVEGYREMIQFQVNRWSDGENARVYSGNKVRAERNPLRLTYVAPDGEKAINLEWFISELIKSDLEQKQWDHMRLDEDDIGVAISEMSVALNKDGGIEDILMMSGYLLIK